MIRQLGKATAGSGAPGRLDIKPGRWKERAMAGQITTAREPNRLVAWVGSLEAAPFALATIVAAAASVASIFVLTRLLAAEGYGLYAAMLGLVMIVQNAGYLALQTSIIRFHSRAQDAEARHRLATAVRLAFLAATLAVAIGWLVAVRWLGGAGMTAPLALAGLVLLVLRGWLSLVQAWNRAMGRPWAFFWLEAVQAIGSLTLAVAALTIFPGEPAAAIWAAALGTCLAAALSPGLLAQPFRLRGSGPLLRELLGYGAPLALVFFAGATLAVSDRLLVAVYAGASAAGAYAVAFSIADRVMTLLLLPVPLAAKPGLFAMWERDGEAAARPILMRSARWLIILGFPAATILAVAPEPLANLLAGGGLAEGAALMIPWLAVGSLLSCLTTLHFSLSFQLARKTQWMLVAIGIPAALNVGANLVLIPRFGMSAAGWTTVGGYAAALFLVALLGRPHLAIPFPLKTTLRTLLACGALAMILRLLLGS
jgi:O-antigen/teichoic acid export membrane protein